MPDKMSMSSNHPTLGFLTGTLSDSRFCDAWRGALEVARQYSANVYCFCVGSIQSETWDPQNPQHVLCDLIQPQRMDGLLTFQWWHDADWFKHICQPYAPMPIVNIMRHFDGFPGVRIDNRQGIQCQLEHLIEVHGYRNIAYLIGSDSPSAVERYHAYQATLRRYSIPVDPALVVPHLDLSGVEYEHARQGIRMLLDERNLQPGKDVEAIATFNDSMAFGAVDELQQRGIQIPYDIAVIGFDNQEDADFSTVPLTTVAIPWYDLGRHAADMLLHWMTTGVKPAHQYIPPTLIVRRSCGCQEPEIQHAWWELPNSVSGGQSLSETSLRERILSELIHQVAPVIAHPQRWSEQILDAFLSALEHPSHEISATEAFLRVFERGMQQIIRSAGQVEEGQDVISTLSRNIQPQACQNPELWRRADLLCQQGRILLHKLAQRTQQRKHAKDTHRTAIIREIGQRLITTFDLAGLMDVLAEELPRLGILSCYLALYDDASRPTGSARLILAYNEHGRMLLSDRPYMFPAPQLLPDEMLVRESISSFVVEALFFGENQIGFVLFGNGPQDGKLYHILRTEISSALQGALLVQEVRERDAALIREKYVIDMFLANVPDRIYFKDCEGRLMRANTAYVERLGLSDPAAVIGKTDYDFFPETQARMIAEREQEIVRTGIPQINQEARIPRRDGTPGWALATKMPLCDEHGDIVGIFGISRDITELKLAEQELIRYREHLEELVNERTAQLRQINERLHESIAERAKTEETLRSSEQQYRLLAENVKDGIVIVQDGRIAFANTIVAGMLGIAPEALTGNDPAAVFRFTRRIDEPAGETVWQTQMFTPDGQELWAEIEQAAIVWNRQPATLLTIRNITARKQKEQQLEEERSRLHQENITLRSNIKERFRFGPLIGKSLAMQQVYEVIISAASSDVNVLINGESGTGKELIARTIHRVSARRDKAFVAVNCASIPETLFEREFFGHRRGAFTGADRDHPGLFDRAHQGVLFLDEVTELTSGTQAKLLRVLQDGEYTPLGSNAPKRADVLIVAATNKDPQAEIAHGRLRQDFFYRICVIEINVPPLRERKDDLPLLIEHILERYSHRQSQLHAGITVPVPSDQTMLPGEFVQALYAYDWPGNIRELHNILQRYLATQDLAPVLAMISTAHGRSLSQPRPTRLPEQSLTEIVQTFEKQIIADALASHRYRVEPAAEELQVNLRTLYRKIKQYGLSEW